MFQYRGMSRLEALFGNSGPSRFHRGVQIQHFPDQIFQVQQEALGWVFEARHQVSSYRETLVRKSRRIQIKKNSFFFYQKSVAGKGKDRWNYDFSKAEAFWLQSC